MRVIHKLQAAVEHMANHWSLMEWMVFAGIMCLLGFICMRGYGSQKSY
jgi:choline-glycine betaine transporter